jgi:hypothetical protein
VTSISVTALIEVLDVLLTAMVFCPLTVLISKTDELAALSDAELISSSILVPALIITIPLG